MDKKQLEMMAEAFAGLSAQKKISKDEVVSYFIEILVKVFSRDENFDYDNEEMLDGVVEASFNPENGQIEIKRIWTIVEEIEENLLMQQFLVNSEEAEGKAIGEQIIKEVKIEDLSRSKILQIKQLMIQKLREAEKEKIYEGFKQHAGENITATVRIIESKGVILDYNDTAIFMPNNEMLFEDKFEVTQKIKVFVSSIDKISKDAQVIGSRVHPQFVANVIKEEVDDVKDGVVQIKGISRLSGFKTKVAVTSTTQEVDPVGAIVGVKGNKIREIMNLLKGERVDVIRHSEDINEFIASALTPARVKGIKYSEAEDEYGKVQKKAIAVVEEDQFLSALGKQGKNVRLAVMLTGVNIDVKTVKQAEESEIEFVAVKDIFISKRSEDIVRTDYTEVVESDTISLEDMASIDIDLDLGSLDFEMEMYADEAEKSKKAVTTHEGIELGTVTETIEEEEFAFDEGFEDEFEY